VTARADPDDATIVIDHASFERSQAQAMAEIEISVR
jgi:hypothetical protein